jgi:hypothetical protein
MVPPAGHLLFRADACGGWSLGTVCRELGASDLGPGAAFSGRGPNRGGGSQGESGVNLGDSGPDSGAVLPVSLPEVLVSLLREFLSLAIVIGAPSSVLQVG